MLYQYRAHPYPSAEAVVTAPASDIATAVAAAAAAAADPNGQEETLPLGMTLQPPLTTTLRCSDHSRDGQDKDEDQED